MMPPVVVIFGIVSLFIASVFAEAADIGKSYQLYHKLGNANIKPRGTITIAPDEDGGLVATFHPDKSARLEIAAFDDMVENSALYTLVVLEDGVNPKNVISSYPKSKGQYVSASVPGCSLRRSNLREEIELFIGPTGKLLSVSYRPIISPLMPKKCEQLKPLSLRPDAIFGRKGENESDNSSSAMPFKTTVSFDSHNPMAAVPLVLPQQRPPPGLKWYRRNAKNNPNAPFGGTKEGGGIPGVDDEPLSGFKSSFLYKYWYVIVPLAIMGLFGGVDEEEVAKQRVQAAGGGAATGAVAAGGGAATGAVAAGGAKKRRGKRD